MFSGEALDLFLHELAVYGVTVHPTIDTIFASAGEDGQVLLYDTRAVTSSGKFINYTLNFLSTKKAYFQNYL